MTIQESLMLSKVCAACGKERKTKALLYDPQSLLPYCNNPYVCNDLHPNSTPNIIKHQRTVDLLSFESANEAYRRNLIAQYGNDHETIDKIYKMLTMPTTLRIQSPEMAEFLVAFEREMGFTNLSDTIRYCIEIMRQNRGKYMIENREALQQVEREQTTSRVIQEIEEPEAETVPASSGDDSDFGTF